MKIILAKNIGFCTGAKRALKIANESLVNDPWPIYFLGEIIHNEEAVKEIKRRGVKIISSPEQAKSGTLVIRAHGAQPFSRPKTIQVRDATCPLVKKVQEAAKTMAEAGLKVIIIGEKNHPEVKGIQGYIKNRGLTIDNEREAKKLKDTGRIGVVAQTTQNLEKVKRILKILRKKSRGLQWLNTLCPEILCRQKELLGLLPEVNGILVIGSPTSSNTNQLVKMAQRGKKPVWRISSLQDIQKENLKGVSSLGVVSGASTPNWEIEKIKKWLEEKVK